MEKRDLIYMLSFFLFGVFFNQVFFLEGLNLTTPINASLLMLINPVLTIVFGMIILKEKLSGKRITGVAIAMAGTALLILGGANFMLDKGSVKGDVLILLTATSWALFLVVMKKMTNKYSGVTVMKWVFLFGLLPNIAIGYNQFTEVNFSALPVTIITSYQ